MRLALIGSIVMLCVFYCGCNRTAKDDKLERSLGSPHDFREHASASGCRETLNRAFKGDKAFTCIKKLRPCTCALRSSIDTTRSADSDRHQISLVEVDLYGCPAGSGVDEVLTLLEPLIPADKRSAFRQFVTTQRIARTPEQQASTLALQTDVFGPVHATVMFGVASDIPRLQVSLDTFTEPGRTALLPDARTFHAPCVEDSPP